MISYSFYSKLNRYIKRNVFRLIFSHTFKSFGKKASIIDPDIIEGEQYITIGDYASINSKAWLLALKQNDLEPQLLIEEGVTIGRFSHIVAIQSVVIQKNVLIADKVYISDNLHAYQNINQPIINQPILFKNSVEIGENSWIGENVSIIGAKIGKHCIIGANSVVSKDIPDYCVAVGIPAKIIKRYDFQTNTWIAI
jgi:acetyltransferase-like isoleucine patch superfamily enzyme